MDIRTAHHSTHNTSCFGIQLNHVDPLEGRCFIKLISAVLSDLHKHCSFLIPLHKVGVLSVCMSIRPFVFPSVTFRVRAITYLCIDVLSFIRQLHLTLTDNRGSDTCCFIRSVRTWSCDRTILIYRSR